MENSPEFVSYKKLIVFGTEGSGKSSLIKSFEKGTFTNETHSENGK
jgi:GTPase SAR1 family protein